MTALEVCDYFNIACYGDYHIKIDGASARSGNRIHFIKLLDGMSIYDSSAPTFIFDVSDTLRNTTLKIMMLFLVFVLIDLLIMMI